MIRKLEIIDNTISNCYEVILYEWKKPKWWKPFQWVMYFGHTLGKNYRCPRIYQGKTTVKEMIDEEIKQILEDYEGIQTIHNITISKNESINSIPKI